MGKAFCLPLKPGKLSETDLWLIVKCFSLNGWGTCRSLNPWFLAELFLQDYTVGVGRGPDNEKEVIVSRWQNSWRSKKKTKKKTLLLATSPAQRMPFFLRLRNQVNKHKPSPYCGKHWPRGAGEECLMEFFFLPLERSRHPGQNFSFISKWFFKVLMLIKVNVFLIISVINYSYFWHRLYLCLLKDFAHSNFPPG